jgi:hypothetical protein
MSNWLMDSNQATRLPGQGDQVQFSAQYNNASTVDTAFSGAVASVYLPPGYTQYLTLDEDLTVTTTSQFGGAIYGGSSYIVPAGGTYTWGGGTQEGQGGSWLTVVSVGASMNIVGNFLSLDGRSIQNSGTITWDAGQGGNLSLALNQQGGIINKGGGTFEAAAGGTYTLNGDGTGEFTNGGSVVVDANATTLNLQSDLSATSTGVFELRLGSILRLNSPATFNDGASVKGPGTMLDNSSLAIVGGIVTVDTGATLGVGNGGVLSTGATDLLDITGGSSLSVNNGSFQGAGTVDIDAGSSMSIVGNLLVSGIALDSDGNIVWAAGTITNTGGTILNNGTFNISAANNVLMSGTGLFHNNNNADITKDDAAGANSTATIACTFNQEGNVHLAAGTILIPFDWTQPAAGLLELAGGTFQVNGTFTNNGWVLVDSSSKVAAVSMVNNNRLDLANNSTSVLAVVAPPGSSGGNFTQGAGGTTYLAIGSSSKNSQLAIGGTATLGGTLNVSLINGYVPAGPAPITWTLLTFGQDNNQFGTVNGPQGTNWTYGYLPQSFFATWTPS